MRISELIEKQSEDRANAMAFLELVDGICGLAPSETTIEENGGINLIWNFKNIKKFLDISFYNGKYSYFAFNKGFNTRNDSDKYDEEDLNNLVNSIFKLERLF